VTPDSQRRRAELAGGLTATRARIAAACASAGRSPAEITLVAVTKTYPAADVIRLAELGVTDIGENRDQEAAPKAAEVAAAGVDVRWHFVGQLQRNKCRSVVRYADLVHSVDSARLARALAGAARQRERPLDVLVQVSIDGDERRGGALAPRDAAGLPADAAADRSLEATADAVVAEQALRLRGVMAVAPLHWPPEEAYARLAGIAADLRARHPAATAISAGMSADLEAAIRHGATHVRIGTALLGKRPALR
jgi:pyridoxal phosphate enzyme (YggS family)